MCTNKNFCRVFRIYCTFDSASHSGGSDESGAKDEQYTVEACKMPQSFTRSLGIKHAKIAPIEFSADFQQYIALSSQLATHVAVMREDFSHYYYCQS